VESRDARFLADRLAREAEGAEPPQQPGPNLIEGQRDQRGRSPLGVFDTVQKDGFVVFRHLGVEAQFSPRGLIGKGRKPQTPLSLGSPCSV
jgi:hypothetical protein